MKNRVLSGALAGGLVMFIWGAFSHMVLGWEEKTIKQIPNEPMVLATMKSELKESGFYFFPGMDESPNLTKEQKDAQTKQWQEKYEAGPSGILIFTASGRKAMTPQQLLTQLFSDIVVALVAALVLAQAVNLRGYVQRVLFVGLLGLIPFCAVNMPYWNWYGFPMNFTLVQLAERVLTLLIGGLVLAAIIKPATQTTSVPTAATA